MAEKGSSPAAAEAVIDEARSAASGTRQAARWLASALGGIPSLAILTAVVRAPGDQGFDDGLLAAGVGFAALGALIGVLAFARVLAPVPLEEKDLEGFNLTRVPGQPFESYEELQNSIARLRGADRGDEVGVQRAVRKMHEAKALAAETEIAAKKAEAEAKAQPDNAELQKRAEEARTAAKLRELHAEAAAATAAAVAAGHQGWSEEFTRREHIRAEAYRLKAADEVGNRFRDSRDASIAAVVCIAAGVILLGMAPKKKPAAATPKSAALVTLKPNEEGKRALGCQAESTHALRIGGTDEAPTVITLPEAGCAPKTLTFTTDKPKALGTVTTDKPSVPTGGTPKPVTPTSGTTPSTPTTTATTPLTVTTPAPPAPSPSGSPPTTTAP
jgi:hypothetical protein